MNKANMDLTKSKRESQDIYKTLYCSEAIHTKYLQFKCNSIIECLHNTLAVLVSGDYCILTGSAAEGTNIIAEDYGKHAPSMTSCYISDVDVMNVFSIIRVIEEEDTSHIFHNYIYCRAVVGKHTTDGFRKLRIIQKPKCSIKQYKAEACTHIFTMSGEHEYVSSSQYLASAMLAPAIPPMKTGIGIQGPSLIIEQNGSRDDWVRCCYVKTWPKEAESWFTRQTHWPDRKLKSKIRKIGYLLVPTGNRKSQESDLEWRCSFSIAEKILFQSFTQFQRCTFFMLKVLLKEYLPSDINTDGEKELLSSYHIKTLFLWCLEDRKIKWQAGNILRTLGLMFDKLLRLIKQQYFPHYFIPSINLLDGGRLDGRKQSLICSISAISIDLSNKIKQSHFFMGQEINIALAIKADCWVLFRFIHHYVMHCCTGQVQAALYDEAIYNLYILQQLDFSHSMLIENMINIESDVDPKLQSLFQSMYTDPIHDKLLMEVVPGLINQYRGCLHLAKYCMAARDGWVLPCVLHTAETLLKDTLYLDPCSGHVKLACLYIATGSFVKAMDRLYAAESKFLLIQNDMVTSSVRNLQHNRINVERLSYKVYTAMTREVFQKWADGQINSDIAVTWPEYITAPELVQFELIQESTSFNYRVPRGKMVVLYCCLQFPPLSLIQLLKFVCAFYWGQYSTSHFDNLVVDLITSSLYCTVELDDNHIYTVFNMAAWCYIKINKYKSAARMMTVAIESSSENDIMKRCAFSHHFVSYVIAQCL